MLGLTQRQQYMRLFFSEDTGQLATFEVELAHLVNSGPIHALHWVACANSHDGQAVGFAVERGILLMRGTLTFRSSKASTLNHKPNGAMFNTTLPARPLSQIRHAPEAQQSQSLARGMDLEKYFL